MANWLNETFFGIDNAVFSFVNNINCGFLNSFCRAITFLGEKGILYLIIACVFLLFPKTRKYGICIIGAIGLSRILTSYILKDTIARVRPFEANDEYHAFWVLAGSAFEKGYSFPSGHATSVMAFAIAIFAYFDKKWSFIGFIFALIMGFSRVYLIAHYFTDVIFGFIIGTISFFVAYYITVLIYYILEKYHDNKFFKFIKDFDIRNCFKKKEKN